jgi:hypothetical protein
MNAQTKAVGIWTALAGAIVAGVMLFSPSAESGFMEETPPVEQVSLSFMGGQPNGNSSGAVTSGDGNCVAYYTDATNILPTSNGDSNGFTDVYLFNRRADENATTRVSVGFDGQNPNGPSMAQRFRPSIDGECTCVAFSSDATNLVPDDTNRKTDVFLRNLSTQTTELGSRGLNGEPANGASSFTSVPEGGEPFPIGCYRVAFQSVATNLVENDTNDVSDVFIFSISGETTRVSVARVASRPTGRASHRRTAPTVIASRSLRQRPTCAGSGSGRSDTNGTLDIYVERAGVVTCPRQRQQRRRRGQRARFLPP